MQVKLSLVGDQPTPPGQDLEHVFDERGGVIGRSDDCNWVLQCESKLVSRRHAVITFEQDAFYLYDGSVNGVFHNQQPEPIGPGGRVRLADGDQLRIGEYSVGVELQGAAKATSPAPAVVPAAEPVATPPAVAAAPARVAPVDQPAPEPVPAASEPPAAAPAQAARAVSLGDTEDCFSPPAALIPEDWDLAVVDAEAEAEELPSSSIARHLNALEPASARALLDGLQLTGEIKEDVELTPGVINALARSFRVALQSAWDLRTELDALERRLSDGRLGGAAEDVVGFEDARALAQGLVEADEQEKDRLVFVLHDMTAQMRGRLTAMVECFELATHTVVDQFAPEKFEGRYRQQLANAGRGRRFALWLRRVCSPKGTFWGFYRSWYENQRRNDYRPVRQLLEKKFLALYAARTKGQAKPRRR